MTDCKGRPSCFCTYHSMYQLNMTLYRKITEGLTEFRYNKKMLKSSFNHKNNVQKWGTPQKFYMYSNSVKSSHSLSNLQPIVLLCLFNFGYTSWLQQLRQKKCVNSRKVSDWQTGQDMHKSVYAITRDIILVLMDSIQKTIQHLSQKSWYLSSRLESRFP